MYSLYIDRPETFKAKVMIEGASEETAKCRLVVESDGAQILFPGQYSNNQVNIELKNLKRFISEGNTGKMRLEVIADGMYFTPWESSFSAKLSRKVTAEVISHESPDTPQVVIAEVSLNNGTRQRYIGENEFIELLESRFLAKGIDIYNVKSKSKEIKKIVEAVFKSDKLIIDESIAENVVAYTTKALTNLATK